MDTLKIGSTGPNVELVQSNLKKLGFYRGNIDGVFGSSTQNAVKSFQSSFGITSDGIVGTKTWDMLYPYLNGQTFYTVKPGDTLYSIAKSFNTTVNRIRFANENLSINNLPVGLVIRVPFGRIVPTDISYSSNILKMNLSALSNIYPFIQVGIIGSSILNNSIPYVRIGTGTNEVFYSSAIHANEWITSPLLMKFLENYCLAYVEDSSIYGYKARDIFGYTSIYIVPMCNPDGVNLVTGDIKPGSKIFNQAKSISNSYPSIPFPSRMESKY